MPPALTIRPGDRYGRLVIVREIGRRGRERRFLCRCDCGRPKQVRLARLRTSTLPTRSCGCLHRERAREANITHGQSGGRRGPQPHLYFVWGSMKRRCSNASEVGFPNYGGRGIRVCEAWQSFETFERWARANGYQPGLSLERIDVDGHYEPANCTWIPKQRQRFNTRRSRHLTYRGRTQTMTEWARELGLSISLVGCRLKRGWTVEQALTLPPGTWVLRGR